MDKTITRNFVKTIFLICILTTLSFARTFAQAPTITSFSPASGPVGTSVTITGTNFNTTAANNIVFFGATAATVTAASTTSLTVTVPVGATYQLISVLNGSTALIGYSAHPFATTFTPKKGSITTADITAKVDFTTGTNPADVAIGDLDGDGKPDLAITNRSSNTVSLYRNTSASGSITASSFAAKVDFTTGTNPRGVAIGDLDGDGKPDLAVSNYSSNTVSVFHNTSASGSITASSFDAKVDFPIGNGPIGLAIGDVDGDGKPDLSVVNSASNTVSILRHTSTTGSITASSFNAKVDFTTGTVPISVSLRDLDGDGKPDLSVANNGSNTLSVFRNTSTSGSITASSFAAKVDFATGNGAIGVAIGDLDGDGKPDLSVANNGSSTVSVFRNTSTSGSITSSSFAAKVDFTTGIAPFGVTMGDLDGDGKPELVVPNNSSNTVSIFRNTAVSGSITTSSFSTKVDFTTGSGPFSVAIGDLDGDGKPDLAAPNFSSNTVSVLRNSPIFPPAIASFIPASGPVGTSVTITGTGFNATAANNIVFFGATMATVTAASPTSLTVTVPTGATYQPISVLDGATALTGYSATPFITTFTPAKGSITAADIAAKMDLTGNSPYSVAIGDLDGDGKSDLAVANYSSNTVSIFRNTSASGTITAASFAANVDLVTGSNPINVAIGDLDSDGKPELVVTNNSSNTISIFRNISTSGTITTGSFDAKVDLVTGSIPYNVAIGDLDGDGKPDMAVSNGSDNTVSVFLNTSTSGTFTAGSFATKVDFATGINPYNVAIGDLDGDGKPDLAAANASSSTVSVFRNTSTSGSITAGSFAAKVDFTTSGGSRSVAIGDLDGDGKPDLAVANGSNSSVSLLRNTATSGSITAGSFAAKVDFTTGGSPSGIVIGDLDGDGKPDLAVANAGSSTVSVLRNISTSGSITVNSFATKVDITTGTTPRGVAIGDLDGDGISDLAVPNYSTNTVSIFRNNPLFPPTITSFSPASGPVGTSVTITGTNFNNTAANNIVFFGATAATVTAASPTSLTVTVPVGATYQPISVLNGATALTGYSATPFITTFTPAKGSITVADITTKVDFATGTSPYRIAIGDLDGDGKSDLAITSNGSNRVSIFRNTSASGSITAASFAAKIDLITGASPIGVAIGDLDGDGKPELAVTNNSGTSISVFRNISTSGSITTGSFATKIDLTTGNFPRSVVIADMDGDGKPELLSTNAGDNTISVFRNISTIGTITVGSFATKVDFTTGVYPSNVAIGDLDGDGKPDMVTPNSNGNTISILRNTSTSGSITAGSFATKVDFATGNSPANVAISDLDGDGKSDLAVANAGAVSIFRNISTSGSITTGSFAAKVDVTTGTNNPSSIAIGDLDGDSKPDLAVTNGSNTLSVFRNTSTSGDITVGSFATKVDFTTGNNPLSLAMGDLDGDGKPDLTVTNFSTNNISIFRNSPIFAPNTQASGLLFTGTTGTSTTASWTNGDGAGRAVFMLAGNSGSPAPVDLTAYTANAAFATGSQIGSTGWYCVYKGTGTTVNITGLSTGTTYRVMAVEYNGSGSGVVYLTTTATDNPANVTTLPPPTITSFTPASGPVGTSVTITGTNFNNTAANNIVFFGATAATVTAASPTSLTVIVPAGATYQPISVLNGATALIGYSTTPFITTFTPAKGSITAADIGAKVDFATGTNPNSIAIGDLDGDGKADLAVANNSNNTVSIFRNTSASGTITAASFDVKVDLVTGNAPYGLTIGDLDGDGRPDLAVTNSTDNTISVFRNTSTSGSITAGSFATKVDFITGIFPSSVAIGDVDSDGKPDLSVINTSDNTVSILRNTSTSGTIATESFAAKVDFVTNNNPNSIAIGDLDGDGKIDMVTNGANNTVSVFRNTSTSGSITSGSFATKVDFATTRSGRSLAIGDLDGDGKPDLVVTNGLSYTVSILRNTATSGAITATSFAAKVDFATTGLISGIAIGDLDGDGKPEMALANSVDNALSIFRNTATSGSITSGSFNAKVDIVTGARPNGVVIGDIDGDGRPDLAAVNYTGNTLSVFLNSPLLAPTIQASDLVFTGTTSSTTTARWTNGNGAARAVFMLAGTSGSPAPVDLTAYNANTAFASGGQIGTSGWYCVYNGTGTTMNITGLTQGTTYQVMIVEYNGTGSNLVYLTTAGTGNPAAVNTISTVATLTNLSLSSGTLSPGFASGTTAYTASVSNATSSVTLTPTVTDATATIKVNGTTVASGAASGNIALNVGPNTITTVVTAQDGTTTQTYTVTVTRAAGISTVATLTNLSLSSGTLSPGFASGTTSYTASVGNNTSSLTLTPTVTDATATIKVNGTTVASGAASGNIALNVGSNTITTIVTAQDGTTAQTYTVTITRAAGISTIATLSNLSLSSGTLNPAFASGTTAYTASVGNATSSITLTPTVTDATATIKVNGTTVASGAASGNIALNVGPNTITTVVTAQDGTTTQTYTVTVTRAAGISTVATLTNLSLSSGTLSPGFASGTTSYTASVGNNTSSLTLTPTVTDATATIKVNGTTVASGAASGNIALNVGSNTITTIVTAQDGTTAQTYTVTITRAAGISTIATLSNLSLSSGTLNPAFASGTTAYTASVGNATSSITLTPTVTDATATIKVNGTTVASGAASGNIALNVGSNTITTVVTAQDGTTTQTYTVTVTRAASISTVATLTNLSLSSGTLSPGFASGTTSYTASVGNNTSSITLTPTVTDATATIKVNGTTVASGAASGNIALNVGSNTITTVVTAQDGMTTLTYSIIVQRAEAPNAITATNLISPNGDGKNDAWIIKDILSYPNNKVIVYDRGGRTVYTKNSYANDWDGTFRGAPLTEGTYYYVIDLGIGSKPIKGFITIVKIR
jgi:gliding motility-associated-like protein